jgi:hypothetical protein
VTGFAEEMGYGPCTHGPYPITGDPRPAPGGRRVTLTAMSTSPRAIPWPFIEFPAVISDERAGASPPGIELFHVTHSNEPGAQVFVVVRCSPNSDAVGEQRIDVQPRRDIEIGNR